MGIDTQSIVGQTKFDTSSEAALIQISINSKVFIIDGFNSNNKSIRNCILNHIKSEKLIVGHSLNNDIECLLKSLGCKDKEIKQLKILNIIDVWKLFKSIYPEKRFSSLAFICESVLGKEICKKQTLTNWKRRPLRKNQIHYAALDAHVVLKIYQKLKEEFGSQMIDYYCSIEANQI